MEYSFGILFQLEGKHNYFSDGFARGLRYTPTPSAVSQFSRFEALVQQITGGFRVVSPVKNYGRHIQPKLPIPPGTSASFSITVDSPDFYNFTDLPAIDKGKVLYISNLYTRKKVAKIKQLEVRPSQFTLDLSQLLGSPLGTEREILIYKLNGQLVLKRIYEYRYPAPALSPRR
mgnify:CR=1 FL=1